KPSQNVPLPDLATDPHTWLKESAGMHALINQTDTRLGLDTHNDNVDLVLGGYVRSIGQLAPLDLSRACDANGNPLGYIVLTGLNLLNPKDRGVFDSLPPMFRFKDVQERLGNSGSNCRRFLGKCETLLLARREGAD